MPTIDTQRSSQFGNLRRDTSPIISNRKESPDPVRMPDDLVLRDGKAKSLLAAGQALQSAGGFITDAAARKIEREDQNDMIRIQGEYKTKLAEMTSDITSRRIGGDARKNDHYKNSASEEWIGGHEDIVSPLIANARKSLRNKLAPMFENGKTNGSISMKAFEVDQSNAETVAATQGYISQQVDVVASSETVDGVFESVKIAKGVINGASENRKDKYPGKTEEEVKNITKGNINIVHSAAMDWFTADPKDTERVTAGIKYFYDNKDSMDRDTRRTYAPGVARATYDNNVQTAYDEIPTGLNYTDSVAWITNAGHRAEMAKAIKRKVHDRISEEVSLQAIRGVELVDDFNEKNKYDLTNLDDIEKYQDAAAAYSAKLDIDDRAAFDSAYAKYDNVVRGDKVAFAKNFLSRSADMARDDPTAWGEEAHQREWEELFNMGLVGDADRRRVENLYDSLHTNTPNERPKGKKVEVHNTSYSDLPGIVRDLYGLKEFKDIMKNTVTAMAFKQGMANYIETEGKNLNAQTQMMDAYNFAVLLAKKPISDMVASNPFVFDEILSAALITGGLDEVDHELFMGLVEGISNTDYGKNLNSREINIAVLEILMDNPSVPKDIRNAYAALLENIQGESLALQAETEALREKGLAPTPAEREAERKAQVIYDEEAERKFADQLNINIGDKIDGSDRTKMFNLLRDANASEETIMKYAARIPFNQIDATISDLWAGYKELHNPKGRVRDIKRGFDAAAEFSGDVIIPKAAEFSADAIIPKAEIAYDYFTENVPRLAMALHKMRGGTPPTLTFNTGTPLTFDAAENRVREINDKRDDGRLNGDGSHSTVLMASTGKNDKRGNYVWPTLFYYESTGGWVELDEDPAFDEALRRGELVQVSSYREANKLARGSWKRGR